MKNPFQFLTQPWTECFDRIEAAIIIVICVIILIALSFLIAPANMPTEPAPAENQPVVPADLGRVFQMGEASWYGPAHAGNHTANGEIFDPEALTAAHRKLPFGTIVTVENPSTGQSVDVRINDRGPFVDGRIIDLSHAAARRIGLEKQGVGLVVLRMKPAGETYQ